MTLSNKTQEASFIDRVQVQVTHAQGYILHKVCSSWRYTIMVCELWGLPGFLLIQERPIRQRLCVELYDVFTHLAGFCQDRREGQHSASLQCTDTSD